MSKIYTAEERYWKRVIELLPGHALGAATVCGSVMEWRVEFSIDRERAEPGTWNLYWCGEPDSWTDEPRVSSELSCSESELIGILEQYGWEGDVRPVLEQLSKEML